MYINYDFDIICIRIDYLPVDSIHKNVSHKNLIIKHLSAC